MFKTLIDTRFLHTRCESTCGMHSTCTIPFVSFKFNLSSMLLFSRNRYPEKDRFETVWQKTFLNNGVREQAIFFSRTPFSSHFLRTGK